MGSVTTNYIPKADSSTTITGLTDSIIYDASGAICVNRTTALDSGKLSVTGNSWFNDGVATFGGKTTGGTYPNLRTASLLLGPYSQRTGTTGVYMGGIAFDHLLNYSGEGTKTYSSDPHVWIGMRTIDYPGYERSAFIIATRNDTTGAANTTFERMCVMPDGKVGIGTTSPGNHIEAYGTDAGIIVHYAGNSRGGIHALGTQRIALATTSSSDDIVFGYGGVPVSSGTFNEYMRIDNGTGNVGVGTTVPQAKFDVSNGTILARGGTSYNYGAEIGTVDNQGGAKFIWSADNNHGIWMRASVSANGAVATASDVMTFREYGEFQFWTDGATMTQRLTIQRGGNVGIGSSSPTQKVDVDGDLKIRDSRSLFLQRNGDQFAWRIRNESSADSVTYGFNGINKLVFEVVSNANASATPGNTSHSIYASSENTLVLTEEGRAGIGTLNPSYKLHVNGTLYSAGSSLEYKTNIFNYDTTTDKLMQLRPVRYDYKEEYKDFGKKLKSNYQIGLIAEEVANVFPELAVLKNEDGVDVIRNVDYEKLSILLLCEVQKLRSELEEMKDKINNTKRDL